jgi:hypothetical protein
MFFDKPPSSNEFARLLIILSCCWVFAVNAAVPNKPPAPAVNLAGNDITISWSAVTYADYYQFQYKDGSGSWINFNSTYTVTSKQWYNFHPISQRSYRLSACSESGCSGWSSASNPITISPTPNTPAKPVASLSGNDITISWSAVTYADYYQFQYKDGSGSWVSFNSTYTGTSKQWNDFYPISQRSYRLSACSESGCSGWSSTSSAITINPRPNTPAKPVASLAGNDITISWSAVTYADYYSFQYREGSGAWVDFNSTYTGTSRVWYNFSPTTERSFRMSGCNESGCSGYSSVSNAITIYPLPPAFATFTTDKATITEGQTVKLSWAIAAQSQQSVTYNLSVEKPDGSLRYTFQQNTSATTFNHTINMSGTHTFFVQACNGNGECGENSTLTVNVSVQELSQPVTVEYKQLIFIHTDLLGSPVFETNTTGSAN